MRRWLAPCVLLATALAGMLTARAGPDAAAAAQERPTTITLSQSSGPPDANVTVPVYFAAAEGVRTGRLELSVDYPPTELSFVNAELSGLSEGVGVTLEVGAETTADRATVHVVLSAASGAGEPEPVPDGPLVYLVFKVAAHTAPGTLLALMPTPAISTLDDPTQPVTPVEAPEGQIVVSKPGIIACFFYMH